MASFYFFYQNPSGFCFFVQIKGFCYLNLTRLTKFKYSRLPITRTLANSNQNRFPLDFFHTYTVILTSVTWVLDNSNLPLTRSCFCFPSDDLYIILPSITGTMSSRSKKEKSVYQVRNIEFNISKQLCILCLHFLVSSVRLQCPALCILIEVLFS